MKSLLQNKGPALASSKRAIDRGDMCCGGSHAGVVHTDHEHGLAARQD
jgi:hypothetical protein